MPTRSIILLLETMDILEQKGIRNTAPRVPFIKDIVRNNWRVLAKNYGISRNEISRMKPAFRISEE